MGILRKDYILDRWVYYAAARSKRRMEFKKADTKVNVKDCLFCPANEHLTPPEIGRLSYKNAWHMRWFANKFPAVDMKKRLKIKKNGIYTGGYSFGVHEIIVETQHHKSQLSDLPVKQIRDFLEVIKFRIDHLSKLKGIRYVDVFKNHGKDAGTSLVHSHTQIIALPVIPSLVKEEVEASKKSKACPYCQVIKKESKSKRKIFETKNVLAFAPFASRFGYEAWIFPKRHVTYIDQLEEDELVDFAAAMKKVLYKLKSINASYNFYFHYCPSKESLHFHLEILPRISTWGGFELSTTSFVNTTLPEEAAKFYRK